MARTLAELKPEIARDPEGFYRKLWNELRDLNRRFGLLVTLPPEPKEITKKGPLAGIPFSAKDCLCTTGVQSAAGSRILEGYVPPFDATAVAKAKHAGGVLIGKTNQDEFGFGSFSTNSGFGIPKNPLDPTRACGGSSGGAAGLVAALSVPHLALAESTGGSIGCPASFCGVAGLTPTYGLVSRYGLIDYANSLDKIGVMGKSVRDCELGLSVISGYDERDQTSLRVPAKKKAMKKKLVAGIPKEYFEGIDPGVEQAVWNGIKQLEASGIAYREVSLPHTKHALAAYYLIATAEASTNLARYCGLRYGQSLPPERQEMNAYFSDVRSRYFGAEAKRRIILGTFARMAGYRDQYYARSQKVRSLVIQDFLAAFKSVDVLLTPSMPVIAPKLSEIRQLTPIQNYLMDILTVGPNLAGVPHLSVPCGTSQGMPVGLQIIGGHLAEDAVLGVGRKLEASE